MSKIVKLAQRKGPQRATAIFIHGLGGDPLSTWMNAETNEIWPCWLAEDVDGLAVISVGYEAPVSRWRGTAMHLPDRANHLISRLLLEPDLAAGELILVGHSLGGLVIKAMLRRAEAQARDDARSASFLERVAFLATPHAGADLAGLGDRLRILARPSAATAGLVRNDSHLRDLNQWYRGFARERAIEHLILTERRPMRVLGTIVKPDSSDPGLEVDPVPVDANHVDIVKPVNRDADVYLHVRDFLARCSERPASREERKIDAANAKLDALLAAVDARGLERETVIRIAQRLKPETLTLEQAIVELEKAVEIALEAIAKGERGTNEDEFVGHVLARLAELTRKGEFDQGAREVDAALAELGRRRVKQEEAFRRQRRALLEAGVEQDSLRRDAVAVARRIEAIAALEHPGQRPASTETFREYWDRYFEQGFQKGVNFALEIAIGLARRMQDQAADPNEKGAACNRLGNALGALGACERGTKRLEEAVAAYHAALAQWTRDRFPLNWAMAQNGLGIALTALGGRKSGTGHLEESVAAYREALKEYTRQRVPLKWATVMNNLANALAAIGQRERGTTRLDAAVATYREALKERTRERVPLDWGTTQNNLGDALRMLGERESGTGRLEEALQAFREALKELRREHVPLKWAMTQNNLGNVLCELGGRKGDMSLVEGAVTAYREALKENTRGRAPLDWAQTLNNIGTALRALGEKESGTERLEEAVEIYHDALKERTRDRAPLDWAATQNNLGVALHTLGERESGTKCLKLAISAYREALKERTRERVPPDWAMTSYNLGKALISLGCREIGTKSFEEAIDVLAGCSPVISPRYFEWTQRNLSRALALLEERRRAGGA